LNGRLFRRPFLGEQEDIADPEEEVPEAQLSGNLPAKDVRFCG
jgi:hypothetical protein